MPILKNYKFLWKAFKIERDETFYLGEITRTLTLEEMTAIWAAYSSCHYMSKTTYDALPESLKDQFVETKLGH